MKITKSFFKKESIYKYILVTSCFFVIQVAYAIVPATPAEANNTEIICLNSNQDNLASACVAQKHNLAVFQSDGYKILNQNALIAQQSYGKCLIDNNYSTTTCKALNDSLISANVALSSYLTTNLIDPQNSSQADINSKLDTQLTYNLNSNQNNTSNTSNNSQTQTDSNSIQKGLAPDCDKNVRTDANGNTVYGCNLTTDASSLWNNIVFLALTIASIVFVLLGAYVVGKFFFYRESEEAAKLAEAKESLLSGVKGMLILFVISTGIIFAIMQSFGIIDEIINPLKSRLSYSIIETAYAAVPNSNLLVTNPTHIDNIYDLFVAIVQTMVRWILLPVVVFAWFVVGAQFVYARGNPEKLKAARKRLLYVLFGTVIIMMLQGLLIALKTTIASWVPKV